MQEQQPGKAVSAFCVHYGSIRATMRRSTMREPAITNLPPPIYPPKPRPIHQMSQKAAEAAEHVHHVETENAALHEQINHVQALLAVAEEKLSNLRADIIDLRDQRDYYQKRCISIETKLTMVGQVVLDVMKEGPIQEYERKETPITQGPSLIDLVTGNKEAL
jgi:hypothetical protein